MSEIYNELNPLDNTEWLIIGCHQEDLNVDEIVKLKHDSILINYAEGWQGKDLSFLKSVNGIKKLKIIDPSLNNLDGVSKILDLEELSIDCDAKWKLDFSIFKNLKKLSVSCNKHTDLSNLSETVEDLYLYGFKKDCLDEILNVTNLKKLALVKSLKLLHLHGLNSFRNLKSLEISQMSKLTELTELPNIEDLEINSCKNISNYSLLGNLKNMKRLVIENSGSVNSLSFLSELKELENINFVDTKIEDGDLGLLTMLPKLKSATFDNKKHYSHTRDEIKTFIANK